MKTQALLVLIEPLTAASCGGLGNGPRNPPLFLAASVQEYSE